mmetsp:Transcript_36189/g.45119  ORF Transcript_36189/g.45119 Transcript_36189/m.45119 type:complete len:81 (+) Transcript_36189:250-492(+)
MIVHHTEKPADWKPDSKGFPAAMITSASDFLERKVCAIACVLPAPIGPSIMAKILRFVDTFDALDDSLVGYIEDTVALRL